MIPLLVVAGSLFLAILTADRRHWLIALGVAFVLRVALPPLVGNLAIPASPHISTVLILCCGFLWTVTEQLRKTDPNCTTIGLPRMCHIALAVTVIGALAPSGSTSSTLFSAGLVLNQIVAPYVFCLLLYKAIQGNISLFESAARFFATVCLAQAVIALSVFYAVIPQPFQASYLSLEYWSGLGARQTGTLDHPLTLGLLLAAGVPMAAYFKSRTTTSLAILVMVAGISVTESRIGMAGAVMGVLYVLFVGSRTPLWTVVYAFAAAAGFVAVREAGLFEGITNRLRDDGGSAEGRRRAAQLFLETWGEFKFTGIGLDRTKEYFLLRGIRGSSESAVFAYTIGIGLPVTLLYFSLIIWLIYDSIRRAGRLSPASASAIIVLISIQFYASISNDSAAGMILWTTIGFALASASVRSGTAVDAQDAPDPGRPDAVPPSAQVRRALESGRPETSLRWAGTRRANPVPAPPLIRF